MTLKKILMIFSMLGTLYSCLAFSEEEFSVPKSEWAEMVNATLPISLCSQDSFFIACTTQNVEQCVSNMIAQTRNCTDKNIGKLTSKNFTQQQWIELISGCSQSEFLFNYQTTLKSELGCIDAQRHIKKF